MGECILYGNGGGGNPLNFKVVGGTTEPVSPSENMIWVNSDKSITSYVFSATEPKNPEEGMVWFRIGTESNAEFNALKKNSIQLYPNFAKQYVSATWIDVPEKSYQNGAWVEWWDGNTLYENGSFFKISGLTTIRATVENTDVLKITESGNAYALAYSNEKILIDRKTILRVKVGPGGWTYPSYGLYVGLSADTPTSSTSSGGLNAWVVRAKGTTANAQEGHMFDIDISSVPYGEYYFCVAFAGSSLQTGVIYVETIRIM